MSGWEKDAQVFRDVQGARVARWLRDSEAGCLFYGPDGECYHLLEDEAERLEREAHEWIERGANKDFAAPSAPTMFRISALLCVASLLVAALSPGIAVGGLLTAIACVITGSLSQSVSNWRYERGLSRWRRDVARRLAAQGRGGVPEDIAQHHRRHNMFHWLLVAVVVTVFSIVVFGFGGTSDEEGAILVLIVIGLIIAAIGLDIAAKRVDATHRRRKWLD